MPPEHHCSERETIHRLAEAYASGSAVQSEILEVLKDIRRRLNNGMRDEIVAHTTAAVAECTELVEAHGVRVENEVAAQFKPGGGVAESHNETNAKLAQLVRQGMLHTQWGRRAFVAILLLLLVHTASHLPPGALTTVGKLLAGLLTVSP